MQTHSNHDTKGLFIEQLQARAEASKRHSDGTITAGKPGEKELGRWEHGGIQVVHRPDDEQGILRISIGGGHDTPVNLNYCTFRGDRGKCIDLLKKALKALRHGEPD